MSENRSLKNDKYRSSPIEAQISVQQSIDFLSENTLSLSFRLSVCLIFSPRILLSLGCIQNQIRRDLASKFHAGVRPMFWNLPVPAF